MQIHKDKLFNLYLFLFFLAVTFILYYSSLTNYYVHDDFVRLKAASVGSLSENFHFFPVPLLVYRVFFLLFGETPVPARVFNYIMNALMCVLVFRFSFLTLKSFAVNVSEYSRFITSMAASLLFCFHHAHVETIIYYSELHEMLYSVFYISGLIFYLKYKESPGKKYYFFALLCFTGCILSKETAITFIACLFFAEIFLFRGKIKDFITTYSYFGIIVFLFVLVRYLFYPSMDVLNRPESVSAVMLETFKNLIFSFTAFLFSLDLLFIKNIYKGNALNLSVFASEVVKYYPALLLILVASFVIYAAIFIRAAKVKYVMLVYILITISAFVWLMGYERYLYLPSAGFCVLFCYWLFTSEKLSMFNKKPVYVIFTAIIIYNIYSLKVKESEWVQGSEISRKTVSNIIKVTEHLPVNSKVYFPNLPGEYKSSWILRYGVHEIPGLLMKRNDLVFYYIFQEPAGIENDPNSYVYDYFSGNLYKK